MSEAACSAAAFSAVATGMLDSGGGANTGASSTSLTSIVPEGVTAIPPIPRITEGGNAVAAASTRKAAIPSLTLHRRPELRQTSWRLWAAEHRNQPHGDGPVGLAMALTDVPVEHCLSSVATGALDCLVAHGSNAFRQSRKHAGRRLHVALFFDVDLHLRGHDQHFVRFRHLCSTPFEEKRGHSVHPRYFENARITPKRNTGPSHRGIMSENRRSEIKRCVGFTRRFAQARPYFATTGRSGTRCQAHVRTQGGRPW